MAFCFVLRGIRDWAEISREDARGVAAGVELATRARLPMPPLPEESYSGGRNAAGEADGRGTWRGRDGSIYDGEWRDGRIEGRGTYTYPDLAMYEGEFKAGVKAGRGTLTHADGESYDGEVWTFTALLVVDCDDPWRERRRRHRSTECEAARRQ